MNYLWIYFEMKYMILNNLHIIICWIFLGWLFHANAGKWYSLKQLRKHCAFQFLVDQALALLLAFCVNCRFEFDLGIEMQVSSYFNENNRTNLPWWIFHAYVRQSYPEKMEGSILIFCAFIRMRLISLVFI